MLSRAKGGSQGVKNGQINPNSWMAERSRSQVVGKGLVLPRLLWGAGAVTLGGAAASLCLRSPRGVFLRQPWTSSTRSTCCTGPSPSSAPRAAAPSCPQGPGEERWGLRPQLLPEGAGSCVEKEAGEEDGMCPGGIKVPRFAPLVSFVVTPSACVFALPRVWELVVGKVFFFKFLNFKGNEGSVFTGRDWSCCQSLRESWNGLVWRGP